MCDAGGINVDLLNGDVWNCVVASLQCPDGTIADLLSNVGTGGGDVGDEKRRVEAELKRLDAEEVEIAALDVQRVYRREVLHGRMAKLNLHRDELQLKLKELNQQERLVEEASEIEGWIRAYCERLREGLDELDFNGKRQVLAALGVRVYATMMVSAYGDEENARRAEASGARSFVVKPVNFRELREKVAASLEDGAN